MDADAAATAAVEEEEELAAVAAIGDLAKATAKEHDANYPRNDTLNPNDSANSKDENVVTLRGGGGAAYETSNVVYSSSVLGYECAPVFGHCSDPDSSSRPDINGIAGIIFGEAAEKNQGGPEYIRGGGRPKKENNSSPAPTTPASTSAPKRGRPPTKQTKGGGTPKKNAKRAPIKKETNDNIAGVGVLNRKPGSLFDCSACLDIGKIKICCYCACRLCFNKFGKEQTILCDKCDQEYHTFCLGLDRIPDAEWECPACIEHAERKVLMEQRKKVCLFRC